MNFLKNFLFLVFFTFFLVSCVSNSHKISNQNEIYKSEELIIDENLGEKQIENDNSKAEEKIVPSVLLTAPATKKSFQLVAFFCAKNQNANKSKVELMASLYIEECKKEGINSDVAFVQMCLETGFLRFGGLVTEEMNNFCGLGAIDENARGNVFETVELGVIAHVQHLKAYGSSDPLVGALVDPRYKWVNPKGKAPTVFELAGTWAADKEYGNKLFSLLMQLSEF